MHLYRMQIVVHTAPDRNSTVSGQELYPVAWAPVFFSDCAGHGKIYVDGRRTHRPLEKRARLTGVVEPVGDAATVAGE